MDSLHTEKHDSDSEFELINMSDGELEKGNITENKTSNQNSEEDSEEDFIETNQIDLSSSEYEENTETEPETDSEYYSELDEEKSIDLLDQPLETKIKIEVDVYEEEILQTIHVNLPFISNKYEGRYRVIYNFPFQTTNRMYIGEIQNGKRNGDGILYDDNECKKGKFVNNELVSGVHYGNGVSYEGTFGSNGCLFSDNSIINKHGFIFKGLIYSDIPSLDHGFISHDDNMIINFMGFKGKIIKSSLRNDEYSNYMEGLMDVRFTNCFIKQATITICLSMHQHTKNGYNSKFSDVIKFGNIILTNDKKINERNILLNVKKDILNNILYINDDLDYIKSLFNSEIIINTDFIETNDNTLKMYQYSDNNKTMNIDLDNNDIDIMEKWNNSTLVLWALITFPHFHVNFVKNLKNYEITGYQFKGMYNSQHSTMLLSKLFDNSSEYLLKYIKTSYNSLVIHTNVTQICRVLESSKGRICDNNDNINNFYKYVFENFSNTDDRLLNFIENNKLSKSAFNSLNDEMLYNVFDQIRIFQIKY